jgi:two-component system response regulator
MLLRASARPFGVCVFSSGFRRRKLAHRADLHRTYIAGVEGGTRNITLKSISKLAHALEVSIPDLLSRVEGNGAAPKAGAGWGNVVEILMVEDNPDDVALTLAAFREAGIANRIHVAVDGAEALKILLPPKNGRSHTLPQIILLDLNLPKISGLEVLRRIKDDARTRHIPVVVLTISQKGGDIEKSLRLGAAAYIVKPVDFLNFSKITPELSLQWALLKPGRSKTL